MQEAGGTALMRAVEAGHTRFINTGPHFTITGFTYEDYDFGIVEEVPPHPGLNLYAISKGLGQEICRVFALNHPINVILCLFLSFPAGHTADRFGVSVRTPNPCFDPFCDYQPRGRHSHVVPSPSSLPAVPVLIARLQADGHPPTCTCIL